MAESYIFHLQASDERRAEGLGMHTVCNRYLHWIRVVPRWDAHRLFTVDPELRCRQCEKPGVHNPRVLALAETEERV